MTDAPQEPITQVKTCSRCKKTKLLTKFHRDSRSKDGAQRYCKDCNKDYIRNRWKKLKEAKASSE